jgi:hypothetical protein
MKSALLITALVCFTFGVLSGAPIYALPVVVAVLGFAFMQYLDVKDASKRADIP